MQTSITTDSDMSLESLQFAICCIEDIAARVKKTGREVFEILTEKTDVLDTYIIPFADALCGHDKRYIVNDILEVLKAQGVEF